MLILLSWWYGPGWLWAVGRIGTQLQSINNVFAVKVLLRTLFAPWKQITSPSSFHNFFQAAADNAVSRVIGTFVRSTMLFLALLWAIAAVIFGIICVVLWPLIPLSIIILPILTISGAGV